MLNFPRYITAKSCDKLLPLFNAVEAGDADVIEITAKDTKFADPFALCLLAAFCDRLRQQGKSLQVVGMPDNIQSYLSRMDLFKQCQQKEPENLQRNDQTASLMEIQCLQGRQDVELAASKISRAIAGKMPDYNENAQPDEMTGYRPHELLEDNLYYMFNELLENSLTHGRRHGYDESKVWVASQYYPSNGLIRIGIVDSGCGFYHSLRTHPRSPSTDEEAIRLALEPRISCNRDTGLMEDSVNEGIGLTVAYRMVQDVGGTITLLSGHSILEERPGRGITAVFLDKGYWQGVGVAIEVKRTGITDRVVSREVIRVLGSETPEPQSAIDIQFI